MPNCRVCKEQYWALQPSLALIDDVTRLRTPAEIVIVIGRQNPDAARRAVLANLGHRVRNIISNGGLRCAFLPYARRALLNFNQVSY